MFAPANMAGGMAGLLSAEVLFVMPIHTHAVKLDLPAGKS